MINLNLTEAPGQLASIDLSLADTIEMSKRLGYKVSKQFLPQLVIGILRDGFLPAVEIAKRLGVPVEFIRLNRLYEDMVTLTDPLEKDLSGLDVLLVDDIYDYGRTMLKAKQHLQNKNPRTIKTGVLRYIGIFDDDQHAPDFFELFRQPILYPWGPPDHPAHKDYRAYITEMSRVNELSAVIQKHFSDMVLK